MTDPRTADATLPELDRSADIRWAVAELRHMAAIADYWAKRSPRGVELAHCTATEARHMADEIECLIRERDAARREAATFRHDASVACAALDDAKKLAMRQASEIRRLAGPREPPHCPSCDCRSGK